MTARVSPTFNVLAGMVITALAGQGVAHDLDLRYRPDNAPGYDFVGERSITPAPKPKPSKTAKQSRAKVEPDEPADMGASLNNHQANSLVSARQITELMPKVSPVQDNRPDQFANTISRSLSAAAISFAISSLIIKPSSKKDGGIMAPPTPVGRIHLSQPQEDSGAIVPLSLGSMKTGEPDINMEFTHNPAGGMSVGFQVKWGW